MHKLIVIAVAGLTLFTVSLMLVATAAAGPASTAKAKQLIVAMKDPGCHWFYNGGGPNHRKYSKTAVRTGPVQ